MRIKKLRILIASLVMTALIGAGIGSGSYALTARAAAAASGGLSDLDMSAWSYSAEDDVYYQTGLTYCEYPADAEYESMGIFVPGAYFNGKDNGDGTFSVTVNKKGEAGGYTAETAPMVLPVNTPGYSAMKAPDGFEDVSAYTDAGFICLHAGCRGREHGAPAGVTDLKAAIRYVRSVADSLPGDAESIFSFGMSGGGAQSAILGASGDALEYDDYLEAIGAVMDESDVILGAMCWCPITSLEAADMAYEWQMGSTRTGLGDEEQEISDGLAEAYIDYINDLVLVAPGPETAGTRGKAESDRDEILTLELTDGSESEVFEALTLDESEEGIGQAGSYYDYVKSEIERSLENFLADTEFPYTAGRTGGPGSTQISGTFDTAEDYIDALNADGRWVSFDGRTGEVTITSIADFTARMKQASKRIGAFDQLDRGQVENTLFGVDGDAAHFDAAMADVLIDLDSDYAYDYMEDLEKEDELGFTPDYRLAMYSPLYYLLPSREGYGGSMPAAHWRIRTGISQSDTSNTTEINLALALYDYPDVEDVDFAMVWGQGHTEAERTGDPQSGFISWVNSCMGVSQETASAKTDGATQPASGNASGTGSQQAASAPEEPELTVEEDGEYTSREEVALYIHIYGRLPSNYITKREAEELGWDSYRGNLWDVAPGKSIGGTRFGNYERNLPEKSGRKYYECDIDYHGGRRGAKRIVYSNDGLIFYTEDHYLTFEQLY